MGPSCKRKTRSSRKSRKTIYKKRVKREETPVAAPPCTSPVNSSSTCSTPLKVDHRLDYEVIDSAAACTTPKAEKFRIPEIKTCPPAPKKRRILSNCSLRRSPAAFFAPPDLELFFFVALRDHISA